MERPRRRRAIGVPLSGLLLAGLACSGGSCGCGEPLRQVRWPASPDVSLEDELRASTQRASTRRASATPEPTPERPDPLQVTDAPGVSARAFQHEGLWVAEVVIGDVPPDAPLPLVMMLHGRGDAPRVPGGPFGRVPTPMRVLLPRGPLRLGSGYAWARYSVGQPERLDEVAADLIEAAQRLARLLSHVRATRATLGTPIVTGFSQGGMLAWTLSVRHPEVAGLALPIAAWVPPGARPSRLQASPTRAMHGVADPIVPVEPTRAWVEALRAAGNAVDWIEYEGIEHLVSPEMNLQFETWLEQALQERAPGLAGGPGLAGADPEPVEPYEPALDTDLAQPAELDAAETDAAALELPDAEAPEPLPDPNAADTAQEPP